MQPEADELLAALAPETDADEDRNVVSESVSESEGASDDGGEWEECSSACTVRDRGGDICSICCIGVTLHCEKEASGDKCPLVEYWYSGDHSHHNHCQS